MDVSVERVDDDDGDERGPPAGDEHNGGTEQRAEQRYPRVIVLVGGSPAWVNGSRVKTF